MKSIFRTSFYLRSNYLNKEGKSSVMMRIHLNGERVENDHFAATPCIIVFYFFILFNCSHIVATTEYFESTRRYCYPKCALAFLGFKSTKK